MNTILFLQLILHTFFSEPSAEKGSKENLRIVYVYIGTLDTTGKKERMRDTMHLDIYQDSAIFYSKDYCEKKAQMRRDSDKLRPMLYSGHIDGNEFLKYISDGSTEIIKKDFNSNFLSFYFDTYTFYQENLPRQTWNILPDTGTSKTGIFCQKATTTYGGREYIVWFAPKYNVTTGPWKFHGLPGMIVKVYDTKLQFSYEFVRMETFTDNSNYYFIPEDAKKTSKKNVHQRMKLAFENRQAYNEMNGISTDINYQQAPKRYNPQELVLE